MELFRNHRIGRLDKTMGQDEDRPWWPSSEQHALKSPPKNESDLCMRNSEVRTINSNVETEAVFRITGLRRVSQTDCLRTLRLQSCKQRRQ